MKPANTIFTRCSFRPGDPPRCLSCMEGAKREKTTGFQTIPIRRVTVTCPHLVDHLGRRVGRKVFVVKIEQPAENILENILEKSDGKQEEMRALNG